jgi:hypothetical protein
MVDTDLKATIRANASSIINTLRRLEHRMENLSEESLEASATTDKLGDETEQLGDAAQGVPVPIETLESALDDLDDTAASDSAALRRLGKVIDVAGDEATEATLPVETLNQAIENIPQDAFASSTALRQLKSQIEKVGDESTETGVKAQFLSGRIDRVQEEAQEATTSLGLLATSLTGVSTLALVASNTGLATFIATLGTVIALATAAAAAVAGLAVAAVGLAGALAGVFGFALVERANELKNSSQEIESTFQGIQEILSGFGDLLGEALQPLQGAADIGVASVFETLATATNEVAKSLAVIAEPAAEVAGAISDAFGRNSAAILAQFEQTTLALLPILEDLGVFLAQSIPAFLEFVRNQALKALPALSNFGQALLSIIKEVARFGATILGLVLPFLTPFVSLLAAAGDVINSLLDPIVALGNKFGILEGVGKGLATVIVANAIASSGAALAQSALATATTGVAIAASVLAAILSPIGVLVAAVVAGLIALADIFGFLDPIINAVKDAVEGLINAAKSFLGIEGPEREGRTSPESIRERTNRISNRTKNEFNFDIDASGGNLDETTIQNIVRESVKKERRTRRQRQSGQSG